MIYAVTAHFSRPINCRDHRSATDPREESVGAKSPEAAALKWFWRLTAEERDATTHLVVSAYPKAGVQSFEVYRGPDVEFRRLSGKLEPD